MQSNQNQCNINGYAALEMMRGKAEKMAKSRTPPAVMCPENEAYKIVIVNTTIK